MLKPKNMLEFELSIGKINYYNKFTINFSERASALNVSRRQSLHFVWGDDQ